MRRWRATIAVLVYAQTSACVVPNHMHVTEGTSPKNIDKNVRFRTTYYFRVFDYCWSAKAQTGDGRYDTIVPETDTLYRYRMTGKASALGSRIKFESGVLPKEEIEPFGADVVFNQDINGFVRRTPEEARAEAKAAAARREADDARAGALARVEALSKLLQDAPLSGDVHDALKTGLVDAMAVYTGNLSAPLSALEEQRLDKLQESINSLDAKVSGAVLSPNNAAVTALANAAVAEIQKQVAALRQDPETKPPATVCAPGDSLRKGFQIMGPEGMRPFDQSTRLIMAMSTSAKPLIETLNEYSGRVLNAQRNPTGQLLALSRETTRVLETQRAIDGVLLRMAEDADNPPTTDAVFDAALDTFKEPVK